MSYKSPAPFLKSKNQLLGIEWAKSNKWDIRLLESDAPEPFKAFFPAIKVTEPVFSLEDHSFSIGNASLDIIKGYKQPELSIEFYDDHNSTLEKYMEKWVNSRILGNYTYTLPIESTLKKIEVYKYNNLGKKVQNTIYQVCPKGDLVRENESEGEFVTFSMAFIIASISRN